MRLTFNNPGWIGSQKGVFFDNLKTATGVDVMVCVGRGASVGIGFGVLVEVEVGSSVAVGVAESVGLRSVGTARVGVKV